MVASNPSMWERELEEDPYQFKFTLGYRVRDRSA